MRYKMLILKGKVGTEKGIGTNLVNYCHFNSARKQTLS